MNADQKIQPIDQNPGVVPDPSKETSPSGIAPDEVSGQGLAEASHQDFTAPADLSGVMQPVKTPNLSGVSGTGAVQHPPIRSEVSGNIVKITPPDWVTEENVEVLLGHKPDDSGRGGALVYFRQKLPKAA